MTKYIIIFGTFLTLNVWGQKSIEGKYVRVDNSGCYVTLNSDKTFKYEFGHDLQWDVACGQFEMRGDSIFLHYQSDMFDRQCNTEGINYTDSVGIILKFAIDKRFRPITARLSKNKLTTIKIGDIGDPETIRNTVHYYKKKKE